MKSANVISRKRTNPSQCCNPPLMQGDDNFQVMLYKWMLHIPSSMIQRVMLAVSPGLSCVKTSDRGCRAMYDMKTRGETVEKWMVQHFQCWKARKVAMEYHMYKEKCTSRHLNSLNIIVREKEILSMRTLSAQSLFCFLLFLGCLLGANSEEWRTQWTPPFSICWTNSVHPR